MSITGMQVGSLKGHRNVIDAFASEPHYAANVFPVLEALPESHRGRLGGPRDMAGKGPVIVSSYNDLRAQRERPVIFMEHGSGQTYGDGLSSYAGSKQRDGVVLFLNPNERVADANYATHPDIPGPIVGTPKLDKWWDAVPSEGVVGMTWHWDGMVVPEATTALRHYVSALADVAKRFQVIGSAHPRIRNEAARIYDEAGIGFTLDPEILYRKASVLVCDNTSLGWEFIAMDRPVVWCNAPSYRRHISHGLRFWEYVDAGIEIDEPAELVWAIDKALAEPSAKRAKRAEVRDVLYPYRGEASQRAATAAVELVAVRQGRKG